MGKEQGDRMGEGKNVGNLGNANNGLGEYDKAIDYYEQHLVIAKEVGDRLGEGNALGNLGIASQGLGDYDQAIDFYVRPPDSSTQIEPRPD